MCNIGTDSRLWPNWKRCVEVRTCCRLDSRGPMGGLWEAGKILFPALCPYYWWSIRPRILLFETDDKILPKIGGTPPITLYDIATRANSSVSHKQKKQGKKSFAYIEREPTAWPGLSIWNRFFVTKMFLESCGRLRDRVA